MNKQMNLKNYKKEVEEELNKRYPNHTENQQLMKESEQILPIYLEDNLSPSEAVSAMVLGL